MFIATQVDVYELGIRSCTTVHIQIRSVLRSYFYVIPGSVLRSYCSVSYTVVHDCIWSIIEEVTNRFGPYTTYLWQSARRSSAMIFWKPNLRLYLVMIVSLRKRALLFDLGWGSGLSRREKQLRRELDENGFRRWWRVILHFELNIYLKTHDHMKKCSSASAQKIGINIAGRRGLRTRRNRGKRKFQLNTTFKSYTAGVRWHGKMDRQLSEISYCHPSRQSERQKPWFAI